MADSENRRQCERYVHEEPVMIYTNDQPEMSCYGRTCNYSEKGMYLETDGELEVGKYYVIKMLSYYDESQGPEPYREYCGSVRWTRQQKAEEEQEEPDMDMDDGHTSGNDDEVSYSYGYGLEYA